MIMRDLKMQIYKHSCQRSAANIIIAIISAIHFHTNLLTISSDSLVFINIISNIRQLKS